MNTRLITKISTVKILPSNVIATVPVAKGPTNPPQGELVAEGTPEQLINQVSGTVVSFMLPDGLAADDARSTFGPLFGADVRVAGRLIESTISQPTAAVHRLTGWAMDTGVELESLSIRRASLEDVYLALVDDDGDEEEPA